MPPTTHCFRLELQRLLQRLVRLVQEIGDCHRQPETACACVGPVRTANLRPTYLRLLRQATDLARGLGFDDHEAAAYVTSQLLTLLRGGHPAGQRALRWRAA